MIGIGFLPLAWAVGVVIVILLVVFILSREMEGLGSFMILYREVPIDGHDPENILSHLSKTLRMRGYPTRREGDRIVYEDMATRWVLEKSSLDGEPSIAIRADVKGGFALATIVLLVFIWIIGVLLAAYAIIKFFGVRDSIREALAEVIGRRVYTIF